MSMLHGREHEHKIKHENLNEHKNENAHKRRHGEWTGTSQFAEVFFVAELHVGQDIAPNYKLSRIYDASLA
jgi:hypothetical protein